MRPRPLLGSVGFWRPCPPRKGPSDRIADLHAFALPSVLAHAHASKTDVFVTNGSPGLTHKGLRSQAWADFGKIAAPEPCLAKQKTRPQSRPEACRRDKTGFMREPWS